MNAIQIIRGGRLVAQATLTDDEWAAIDYVDYIDIDSFDRVTPEFVEAHGLNACCRMQRVVGTALA